MSWELIVIILLLTGAVYAIAWGIRKDLKKEDTVALAPWFIAFLVGVVVYFLENTFVRPYLLGSAPDSTPNKLLLNAFLQGFCMVFVYMLYKVGTKAHRT